MSKENKFIDHHLIVSNEIEKREYQDYLFNKGVDQSTLIVLPTGLGKTIVSLYITADRLLTHKKSISLLLAPTKPLVKQHKKTYQKFLDISDSQIIEFSGDIRPEEREQIWNDKPSVVIATPQVIQNDLINNRISLENVSHLTFDESHKAMGEYPYGYIADKYVEQSKNELITGLSASPGETKEDILTVCDNINVSSIEVLTEDNEMVSKYIHDTKIKPRFIDINEDVLEIRDTIQEIFKDNLVTLKEEGYINSARKDLSTTQMNRDRGKIQKEMQKGDSGAYKAMSLWAESMKLKQAIERIETQGHKSFIEYYNRLENEAKEQDSSKAVQRIISNPKIQKSVEKAKNIDEDFDKLIALKSELVHSVKLDNGKALVFTKSRDTVSIIIDYLSDDFEVGRLVGQSDSGKSKGMKQSEQQREIEKFSNNEYEVLVSTQVGEEGLDIPQVDLVVFYEPVTRGIEKIQRQGRTGRTSKGKVTILIANDTRDVGFYYKSKNSQNNMENDVKNLQEITNLEKEINEKLKSKQLKLSDIQDTDSFDTENNKYTIIPDNREMQSSIVRKLDVNDNIDLQSPKNLEVGDYIVSNECAIERKSITDFKDTITGERSFKQFKDLSNSYDKPILILEGDRGELYSGNIHKNAIYGALYSIKYDFGIEIHNTINEQDTSDYLTYLAKKEQEDKEKNKTINPHGKKETKTLKQQQEYIVSSVENIGPKNAMNLLEHFGSIKNIVNASKDELKQIDDIGDKKANNIYNIFRKKYN